MKFGAYAPWRFRSLEVGGCFQFPIPNWQHWHLVIGNTFTLATLFPPFRFYPANKGNYSIKKTTFHVSGLYLDFVLLVASRPTIVDDFPARRRGGVRHFTGRIAAFLLRAAHSGGQGAAPAKCTDSTSPRRRAISS
jgi:hypothetical protein